MFLSKKYLSRRHVLRGMGTSIGLPLLDAMIPAATALAQTAANPFRVSGLSIYPMAPWLISGRPMQPAETLRSSKYSSHLSLTVTNSLLCLALIMSALMGQSMLLPLAPG
jgi:hypothetical protein